MVQGGLILKLFFSLLGILLLTSTMCFGATAPLSGSGNVLVGANYNDDPGSSDMTLIVRLSGDGEVYVDEGHDVKYVTNQDGIEAITGWTQPNFNDSGWIDGISGVGFSDGDDNTVTPAGLFTIWTRYHFDAPNADSISELELLVDYDDQAIVWLNGVVIFRPPNAPDGDPPAWNATEAGTKANNSATELAAGTPNPARWSDAGVDKVIVDFAYAGSTAVEPNSKLAITWGGLKK